MLEVLRTDEDLAGLLPIVGEAAYLRAKSPRYGWFKSDDFVLPFFIEKRAFFNRLVFSHQTISLNHVTSAGGEREFLNQVVIAAREMGVDFIYQPQATAVFSVVPDGAIAASFGTYIVNLELPVEKLWANLHGKHRNVVKKAEAAGVEVSEGPHNLFDCYELISLTMKRNEKLSVSLSDLERFRDNLDKNASFYVAKKDGAAQGAAVIVWNTSYTAYYLHGGTCDAPFGGAMNLLHWKAMNDMKARGVKQYDFVGARVHPQEGSKLETIQRFKSRFGASMKEGYLWKYPLKPMRYAAYQLFARGNALMHGTTYKGDIIDEELAHAR